MNYIIKDIRNFSSSFYQKQYLLLNHYQKEKIDKLKNDCDKKLSILGWFWLSQLVSLSIAEIKYQNGKPCVSSKYVSISHKYPYVVVIVHDKDVGIDIEIIREIDKTTLKYLKQDNSLEVLIYWTRYESRLKCGGEGLVKTFLINHELIVSICQQK